MFPVRAKAKWTVVPSERDTAASYYKSSLQSLRFAEHLLCDVVFFEA